MRTERALVARMNRDRAKSGLAAMVWDEALARAAREHARWMAARPGELEHQYAGETTLAGRAEAAGARFAVISENLARGEAATAGAIEEVWLRSSVHRGNLLDGRLNAVGVGVVARGTVFVVADMAREMPVLDEREIERRVAEEVSGLGVGLVRLSEEARRACRGERVADALVEGWDGTEPTRVPERVRSRLGRERFGVAEVGACGTERAEAGFRTFRVAVVLR